MKKLTIIVPILNENKTIRVIYKRLMALTLPIPKEIIFVDDGSTDGTRHFLQSIQKNRKDVTVIYHNKTYGKGAAIRSALTKARGSHIVIQDADLEYNPSEIINLLTRARKQPDSVVYGSRNKDIRNTYLYPIFFWGSKGLSFLINTLFKQHLTDPVTCYKLMPTQLLTSMNLTENGFGVEIEITCKAAIRRYTIEEVSITYNPRTFEDGKKIRIKDGLWAVYLIGNYWIRSLFTVSPTTKTSDTSLVKQAVLLHKNVPPDWYESSIRTNIAQRYWHMVRARELRAAITPVAGSVLDIGCADGYFSNIIREETRAKRLIGIDVLRASIAYAKKRYSYDKSMVFRVADAHNLPFPARTFSAVFSIESLEHVLQPERVLQEIRRVLKKGGYVIILIPSENTLFKILWYVWTRTRGKIWKDSHVHTFPPHDLPDLLQQAGFTRITVRYFLFNMLLLVKGYK